MATFASADDIAARVGRTLTDAETTQVDLLLGLATSLIAEAAGKDQDWVDDAVADAATTPVPATYRLVCIEAVFRGLQNPSGVESQTETLGAYSHTERYATAGATGGFILTGAEERRVRRAAFGTNSGSVRLGSIVDEIFDDQGVGGGILGLPGQEVTW